MENESAGGLKTPIPDFEMTTTLPVGKWPFVDLEGSVSGQKEFTDLDLTFQKTVVPMEMSSEDMEDFVAGWVASLASHIPELQVFRHTDTFPTKYSTDGSTGPSPEEAEA